jgi:6-phosphofructokinase 1
VLGHIQRGGAPSAQDRILAARLGQAAVEALVNGQSDRAAGIKDGDVITIPLSEAIKPRDFRVESYYRLIKVLT